MSAFHQFSKDLVQDREYQESKFDKEINPWYTHYDKTKDKFVKAQADKIFNRVPNMTLVTPGHVRDNVKDLLRSYV